MSRFNELFPGVSKPLIAMAHVPPLPGTPLFDHQRGVQGLVDQVRRDVEILLEGGFDALLFCNEGDRPYQLQAGTTDGLADTDFLRPLGGLGGGEIDEIDAGQQQEEDGNGQQTI